MVAKSWIEKSKETSRKNPKIDETPTDIRTPSGAFQDALLVSSDKCADASKPVKSLQVSGYPDGRINAPERKQSAELILPSSDMRPHSPVMVYWLINIPHAAT